MDAVKFIKESKRLCKAQESCGKCVAQISGCCLTDICVKENSAEKTVAVVEQWSKDHPVKTRQSELLEMFPDAKIHNGVIDFCPKGFLPEEAGEAYCGKHGNCNGCRKDYWLTEVTP